MGQIKHKMGKVGGGVDISHKSKMSGKAKSLMSFPGGMPGPGDYGKMEQPAKIVGKGMAKYLAGESVGMKKMDPMHNGQPGVQQEDFEQFGTPKSTGPSKYTRSDKTKAKAKDAKDKAEKTLNDSGITVKGTMQAAKAERLAKRQKRQEGRAERKNIRKKAKQGKIIEGETGEYNAMSKKQKIKASRKKQKSTSKSNGMAQYEDGPMKTKMDPKKDAKALKSLREIAAKKKKDKLDEKLKRGPSGKLYAKSVSREKRLSEMKSKGPKKTDPCRCKR